MTRFDVPKVHFAPTDVYTGKLATTTVCHLLTPTHPDYSKTGTRNAISVTSDRYQVTCSKCRNYIF